MKLHRFLAGGILLLALGIISHAPAGATQPNVNPSTIARDVPRSSHAYVDTLFVLASGDSARWAFGFEAPKVEVWTYSKPVFLRYVGFETLVTLTSSQGLTNGYRKRRPRFSSVEFPMPANSSDAIEAYGCRGVRLRATVSSDTVYVRAYVPAWAVQ